MKKTTLATWFVGLSAAYVAYLRLVSPHTATVQPSPTPDTAELTPTPAASATPRASAGYSDGSYTGDVADSIYGPVQVKAVVSGGKLTDVVFLQYPNDRPHSAELSSQAMPVLKSEAIQAQNANVDVVSGATQTAEAFSQSLASALSKATH